MGDILVLYAARGVTFRIAAQITARLRQLGQHAEAVHADAQTPPAAVYDAVVIGSPAWLGRFPRTVAEYIAANRVALKRIPNGYFTVGAPKRDAYREYWTPEERFFDDLAWRPARMLAVGQSLRGLMSAWMESQLEIKLERGTDWAAAASFADSLVADLAPRQLVQKTNG